MTQTPALSRAEAADVPRLLTAAQLAAFLNVDPAWVYAHAEELAAWRLGSGPKARLRFDLDEVRRRLTVCPTGRESEGAQSRMVKPKTAGRRRSQTAQTTPLLPI